MEPMEPMEEESDSSAAPAAPKAPRLSAQCPKRIPPTVRKKVKPQEFIKGIASDPVGSYARGYRVSCLSQQTTGVSCKVKHFRLTARQWKTYKHIKDESVFEGLQRMVDLHKMLGVESEGFGSFIQLGNPHKIELFSRGYLVVKGLDEWRLADALAEAIALKGTDMWVTVKEKWGSSLENTGRFSLDLRPLDRSVFPLLNELCGQVAGYIGLKAVERMLLWSQETAVAEQLHITHREPQGPAIGACTMFVALSEGTTQLRLGPWQVEGRTGDTIISLEQGDTVVMMASQSHACVPADRETFSLILHNKVAPELKRRNYITTA